MAKLIEFSKEKQKYSMQPGQQIDRKMSGGKINWLKLKNFDIKNVSLAIRRAT